jgi:hypothetical protein
LYYKDSSGVVQSLASKASTSGSFTNLAYTGTLTGGTGVVNLGSGQFYKDASGNIGIGISSPSDKLSVLNAISVQPSATYSYLNFRNSGSSVVQQIQYSDADGSLTIGGGSGVAYPTIFRRGSSTESMRIDSSGNLLVGLTSQPYVQGRIATYGTVGGVVGWASYGNTDGYFAAYFHNASNTAVGSIQVNASTTTYATSSDYRLKENVVPMQNALATVLALKPVTYDWKTGGSSQGFIAHELQSVVPDCVVGEKDAVDAKGKPVYQGIDTSFLVATLTAAIQELNAKFEEYKASHP